jgi:small subunit ribosomal protein S6
MIIDPEAGPEDEEAVFARIEGILTEAGGTVVDKDPWGRRQLAYPIKKKSHGIYHFWKLDVGGEVMKELNFELRTNDMVMRSMILNLDTELRRHHKGERLQAAKAAKKAAKAERRAEAAQAES